MTEQRYPPIEEYAFLGDCHDWALVHRDGSVDWCCFERNEGRTVAARLLDWDRGGHCRVQPEDDFSASHRYVDDTNVVVTEFDTDAGTLEVTDALVLQRSDEAAAVDVVPHMQLVRRIRCTHGEVTVAAETVPRFDHGLTSAHVEALGDGHWSALGGEDALAIFSDLELQDSSWGRLAGTTRLTAGDQRWLSLQYVRPELLAAEDRRVAADQLAERLDDTVAFWQSWAAQCTYDGPYRDAVVRSALVLKALTDARTGAVAAAATTSLPEQVGGERNWDYRFAWMRDASTQLAALHDLGYTAEADAFMDWLGRATAGTAADLQVMYRLSGGRMMPEVELPRLEGYRGSAPVRVGNAAAQQFQLDVFGELVETAWRHHQHGRTLRPATRHLLADVVDELERCWQQPDAGIWEQRGAPQQFVSSKLYAWLAADRLAALADAGEVDADAQRCRDLRERIRDDIERYGVDRETGAVLRAYGQRDVDAANLLAVLMEFWPADDPRSTATLASVEDRLAEGPLVHRYRADDGLSGQQNAFLWTSFWMVEARVRCGRHAEARTQFEALLERCSSPLGLLSEECNASTGELVGNFPQAISHVGLVRAALALDADATA